MNAMCSVKKNDVRDHVRIMKREGYHGSLTQTSAKAYNRMDKSATRDRDASDFVDRHDDFDYTINLDTERIHKKGCSRAGKNTIEARLIDIPATGLKVCRGCMK